MAIARRRRRYYVTMRAAINQTTVRTYVYDIIYTDARALAFSKEMFWILSLPNVAMAHPRYLIIKTKQKDRKQVNYFCSPIIFIGHVYIMTCIYV